MCRCASIVSNAHNLWDFTCLNALTTPYLLQGQFFTRETGHLLQKEEIKTLSPVSLIALWYLGKIGRNFLAVNSNSNIEFDGMKKLENHVFKCIFCNCATICFIYVICSKIVKILHLMFFKCALDVVLNFRAETSEHSQFSLKLPTWYFWMQRAKSAGAAAGALHGINV